MSNWTIDPASEATGTALDIDDRTTYTVTAQDFPSPDPQPQYAVPVDADGQVVTASQYRNRTVTVTVRVDASGASAIQAAINALESKCAKLTRDAVTGSTGIGGTLQYTTPKGSTIFFDVCSAKCDAAVGSWRFAQSRKPEVTLTFEARPFARGTASQLSDHAETTLPWLTFTEASITGDVPALGSLVVDDDQGQSQAWVTWGLRSKNYDTALTAQLAYQAEGLTPLGGGAATASSLSGYSGTGYILANSLATAQQAVLSTQMTTAALTSVTGTASTDTFTKTSHGLTNGTRVTVGTFASSFAGPTSGGTYYVVAAATNTFQLAATVGGSAVDITHDGTLTVTPQTHLTHTSVYHVYARVQQPSANTGTVTVAFQWALGDFRSPTLNTAATLPTGNRGSWELVDLGVVTIPTGTSQWEGRILAGASVPGEDVAIDHVVLIPCECSGVASSLPQLYATPTAYIARDEFQQSAGATTGKTLPTGGTWSGAGDTDDFAMDTTSHYAARTAVSDANGYYSGRFLTASTPTPSEVVVQSTVYISGSALGNGANMIGVLARYTDTSNFLFGGWTYFHLGGIDYVTPIVYKVVAGAVTILGGGDSARFYSGGGFASRLLVQADGMWRLHTAVTPRPVTDPSAFTLAATGYDSALAAGSTLASGKVGIYDSNATATAATRDHAAFYAWVPAVDAAFFANRNATWSWSGTTRTDSAGAFQAPMSSYAGDLLMVPVSGAESRTCQVFVKASRGIPGTSPDSGIDDISARLTITPRYLQIPA